MTDRNFDFHHAGQYMRRNKISSVKCEKGEEDGIRTVKTKS